MNNKALDIDSIFGDALECPSAEARAAYLDHACGTDAELRRRVEKLLDAHARAGDFLESLPPNPGATVEDPVTERPGSVIGSYKLLEQIGEGGFGAVFLAEQQQPVRRKVALKVLKPGMDSRQVIARFEAERQALALMDHPNIARILDGGQTASGRPYFVMDLVKGLPITKFCDQGQLTLRERLGLFADVCRAVQHAHQKGIIHRDLKPSNVLVTEQDGRPVVKVIDFGIAKALGQQLTEKTLFTGFAQMIGTPLYMSPEQAGMSDLDVDTRSDVYSLGVLLYELLTGTTPFTKERLQQAGYDEMRRIIREEEPPKPSTRISTLGQTAATVSAQRKSDPGRLSRLFRGELDWVVMKALEKDRNRRYESASAFAADVQRYLSDEPVLARPTGRLHRGWRWCRRNPAVASLLVVTALLLVAGTAVSTAFGFSADANAKKEKEAREEAERSEKELGKALKEEQLAKQREETAKDQERRKRKEAERLLHVIRLSVALTDWQERKVAAAREKLHELPAIRLDDDQKTEDTWEYRYLDHLMNHSGQRTFRGHTEIVTSVAFSPDGKRIASGGRTAIPMVPGEVKVWDAATGQALLTLRGHTTWVTSVAVSPDGKRIASAANEVKVWDTATGRELLTLKGHTSMAFSPDGRYLAAASGWTVKLWDPESGKEVRTIAPLEGRNKTTAAGLAFSPDGKHLAAVAGPNFADTATVWETETGKEVWTVQGKGLFPLNRGLLGVAFSPDGKFLAAGSEDMTVKVWDATTGRRYTPLRGHLHQVNSVAFSPDGRFLASASRDQSVKLWDMATGQEAATFTGHTHEVSGVAFSPDGRRLASASWDATVKVWNAAEEPGVRILGGHRGVVAGVAFSPEGRRLASADAGGRRDTAGRVQSGEVKGWDAVTGEDLLTLKGHTGEVNGVAFSPDGKRLASGCGEVGSPGEVKLWDAESGKLLHSLRGHTREVTKVAFSSDGKYLASASSDQTVKLWDPQTGKELRVLRGHTGFAWGLAFSPDSKQLASGDTDGTVKLWSLETGKQVRSFKAHSHPVFGLAYSPDGKRLASSSGDRTVKLWDAATGQQLLTLRGHSEMVPGVAFSPDGRRL